MAFFNALAAGEESDGSDEWDMGRVPEEHSELIQAGETGNSGLMMRGIWSGDTGIVARLLDQGMDVNTKLDSGWTPLFHAVKVANYDMIKLLLDRGASASSCRDELTVLMLSCQADSSESNISACMELLLARNADPNMVNSSGMSCLMMAAQRGYVTVLNLLVSHGADVNLCNSGGYTALSIAVKYDKAGAVLKLLQLGADKTIGTGTGKSPAELAALLRHTQISKILSSWLNADPPEDFSSTEVFSNLFKQNSSASKLSSAELGDVELLLQGLELSHLIDTMREHDVGWGDLMEMDKDDLEKIGVGDPLDQEKLLKTMKLMTLDKVDMDTISQFGAPEPGTEKFQNFLLSVKQQVCHLTEVMTDTIDHFPQQPSQLVFSLDPDKECQTLCKQLLVQLSDLQKKVTCLINLFCQLHVPHQAASHGNKDGGSGSLRRGGAANPTG